MLPGSGRTQNEQRTRQQWLMRAPAAEIGQADAGLAGRLAYPLKELAG